MNSENKKHVIKKLSKTTKFICAQSAILSLSILLGACAATGKKEPDASTSSAPAKTVVAKQTTATKTATVKQEEAAKEAPQPSAAELMKTLKAPLAEPAPAKSASTSAPVDKPAIATKTEAATAKTDVVINSTQAKTQAAVTATSEAIASKQEQAKSVQASVETKLEAAATPVDVAPVTNAKAFAVSAKKLPFTYDIWTIRKGNTPLTQGLVITTPTWEMGKEGYMSQIWLTMMEDKILVNSSSDIETASKGLGIRLDGGDLIPFSTIAETNIGVINGKWLDRLSAAKKIQIYLGFFPGKVPTSDTFTSELATENLARMVATYRMLNK